jgi:hypothetical protein
MFPLCIFCDKESGSEEHLWGAWIHRRVKFGPIRIQEGTGPELIDDDPERTINTVCHTCNNTWMSRLEEKNIPAVGGMLENKPIVIDVGRQRLLMGWAVKTAMVMDSIKDRRGDEKFYTRDECVAMRLSREIPKGTRIWIGALTESHLGAFGTDFTILGSDRTRIGTGTANTIVVGYFAVQVVTIHMKPDYAAYDIPEVQPKPGDWGKMLIQLYPKVQKKVNWPPRVSFTNGGRLGVAFLMDRWRGGEKVSKITKDGFVE